MNHAELRDLRDEIAFRVASYYDTKIIHPKDIGTLIETLEQGKPLEEA